MSCEADLNGVSVMIMFPYVVGPQPASARDSSERCLKKRHVKWSNEEYLAGTGGGCVQQRPVREAQSNVDSVSNAS
jgi:hypothetical protein